MVAEQVGPRLAELEAQIAALDGELGTQTASGTHFIKSLSVSIYQSHWGSAHNNDYTW